MATTAATLAVTAIVLSPLPEPPCLPQTACMPVEECIAFVYELDLATDEATNSAIEALCYGERDEQGIDQ